MVGEVRKRSGAENMVSEKEEALWCYHVVILNLLKTEETYTHLSCKGNAINSEKI